MQTIGMVAAAGTNGVMRCHGYLSDVDDVSLDSRLPDGVHYSRRRRAGVYSRDVL